MTLVNAAVTGSYFAKGEPASGTRAGYSADFYAYDMVPLGGDRFVILFYSDTSTDYSAFVESYQIIRATAAGWTPVTARLDLPADTKFQRIGARDYGVMVAPNRVLFMVHRNPSVFLLDFTGDVCTVVTSAPIPGPFYNNRRLWQAANGAVVIHMWDGGLNGQTLTALTVAGDTVTVGAPMLVTYPAELDTASTGLDAVVIGNRLLFLGSTLEPDPLYADDPDFPDPYKPKRNIPYWRVFDVPTMTFLTDYFPVHEPVSGNAGVAIGPNKAFVSLRLAHGWDQHLDPSPPPGYLADQGWIATVTISDSGGVTVEQHDGTRWPGRVEAVAMGPQFADGASPWVDPDRAEAEAGNSIWGRGQNMRMLGPGRIAWSVIFNNDTVDDNQLRIFCWDIATSSLLAWARIKTGRVGHRNPDTYLNIGNADNLYPTYVLQDGSLLYCLDEYYQPDPDGDYNMYAESIWLATAAFTDAPIPIIAPGLTAELKDIGQRFISTGLVGP